VPLESMSVGKPIVVTDVGGNPEEVLHQQTGLVVPPDNPAALAQAVLTLLQDAALRSRLGRAGRQRVEAHFSLEGMVARLESVYNVLQGSARCHSGSRIG
jgi:glycosyltransferase involved in cell wall biosynthesis